MKKFISLIMLLTCSLTYAYRDLETGTFLTRDPIGYEDGPNLYCYVHCNPITYFDPLGLKTISDAQEEWDEAEKQKQQELEKWQSKKDDGGFKSDKSAMRAREKIENKYGKIQSQSEMTMRSILGMSAYMTTQMNKEVDPLTLDTDSAEFKEGVRHLIDNEIVTPEKMLKLQATIVATELTGTELIRYARGLRIAQQAKRCDTIISSMSNVSKLKGGVQQGFIKGNPEKIFSSLTKGAEHIKGNQYKLLDGRIVNMHNSTRTGVATIDVNDAGKIFKIRVSE